MKRKFEFSKLIIVFETLIVAGLTAGILVLAFMAIRQGYTGALPFLTALVAPAWGCYGFSAKYYYGKAGKENVLKIKQSAEEKTNADRDY